MKRALGLGGGVTLALALAIAGCPSGEKEAAAVKAKATATGTAAKAAPKASGAASGAASAAAAPTGAQAASSSGGAADFFGGEPPSQVSLITGYVEDYPSFEFAIKTPAGWKGAGQQGWGYMAMREAGGAALFCDIMTNDEGEGLGSLVTFREIATLAKRAPIQGKDLKELGTPAVAKVGKQGYPARVGQVTGNLFGEDGGDVYWIDLRHKQKEGPWHLYCVMGIKKSAPDDVRTEAKAIMRSLEAPRGKDVLEPRMD
jgi:hypothetical protein